MKSVGVGPDPRVCCLRAAFVTSAILCEKLTRTFWKTCIRAFFVSVELTKKPPWGYIWFHRERFTFTLFWCFFIAKDGFLETLSLSSLLYFIATDKRSLLAAVDRNIFLSITTALVNIFCNNSMPAWWTGTPFMKRAVFLETSTDFCGLYHHCLKDFDYFLIYGSWGNISVRSDLCVWPLSVCTFWVWIQICSRLFLGSSYMPQNSFHSCKGCSVLQPPHPIILLTIALHTGISHPALYFKPPDGGPLPS